eukprot:XP_001197490.1 PREDICTED: histone H1, early embryonic-like [Strongylocentrotus purpuratus]
MAEKESSKKVTTKKPAAHPPAAEMVATAITELKDRNGSSLQAIKKYIATNFDVQMDRQLLFIKRALKSGVEKGKLSECAHYGFLTSESGRGTRTPALPVGLRMLTTIFKRVGIGVGRKT